VICRDLLDTATVTTSGGSGPSWLLAPALAVGLLALAGCGPDTASSAPSATATATATSAVTPSAGVPSAGATSTPITPSASLDPSAGPVACTSATLRVGMSRGEGAAGSIYYTVRLTNTSQRPCRTGGFGGVSLVHSATGNPVGAPADRVDPASANPITLAPGGIASATLQVSDAGNYPAGACRPVPTAGFRIYPPDQTRSSFVARSTTGCASPKVHLLRLSPYVPGRGQGAAAG
jgi:hypothetical protein